MSKRRVLLGLLLVVLTVDVRASIPNDALWRQVSSIDLKRADLVEANIGGRAALCSWVEENKTTILVGVKNKDGKHGISKLVYSLDKSEPIVTPTEIDLRGFIPRTILRTSSGVLYLTANTAINSEWKDHFSIKNVTSTIPEEQRITLGTPGSLNGGVWVSIDNGKNWEELVNDSGKGIRNAGYMASYKPRGINDGTVDETAVRVGGAGISSTEIICFKNENSAKKTKNNKGHSSRIQPLDTYHFVISTVFDKIQDEFSNPILTRIGELPIRNDGVDSGKNAIRFTYAIDSVGCNGGGRDHAKVAKIGCGTPIFDTYCNTTKPTETKLLQLGNSCGHRIENNAYTYQYGDNKCFPDGYWKIVHRNHEGRLEPYNSPGDKEKGYKNIYSSYDNPYSGHPKDTNLGPTKDKYRNCVVSYDNSGLFLTKIQLSKEKQSTENIVEAYFGAIEDMKAPDKSASFSNPQEVVAQYKDFMAIADGKQKIYIRSSRINAGKAFYATDFEESVGINRTMITGIHPLDWHNENKQGSYNGRLIALGQSNDKLLVKLYMRTTKPEISYTTVGDKDALDYAITGEPYAKVKLWWQKANEDANFTSLTYNNIKDVNDAAIVTSSEITLDKDGRYESTAPYLPKVTGKYRLVASAVVGGFYCDYNQGLESISRDSISNSKKIDVVTPAAPDTGVPSITQTKFWSRKDTESNAGEPVGGIHAITGEDFFIKVNWMTNSPKGGILTWEQDDKVCFTDRLSHTGPGGKEHTFTFKNDGPDPKQQIITVKLVVGDKEDKKTFAITIEPKLVAPIITVTNAADHVINGVHNICDSKVLDLKIAAKGEIVWQRSMPHLTMWDKQLPKDKTNTLQTLQLIAGPTLHDDPCFSNLNNSDKDQWIFDRANWTDAIINPKENSGYDIKSALHGKTKLELLSQDLILIDAKRSYLYIASAKNDEADTKLTLTLKCYNHKRVPIGDIAIPEETITNAWSSYGAIIYGKDTKVKDKKYLWPKDTVFVQLAINLPENKEDGAYLSAIRLMELSQETIEILAKYDDSSNNSSDPWVIANLWDNEVGRYTFSPSITRSYKAELKSGRQSATSKETTVKVWSNIFFTKYAFKNVAGKDLEIDADPDKPIVVRISTDDEAKLYIESSHADRTWERTTEPDKDSKWEENQRGWYYEIETSDKDEVFFVRAKARIKDNDSACRDQIKYSRIFKIVITKAKDDL
jgi:hypothetical protein